MKNILVRADSSSKIGIGHIMRDLVLVKQYPKANIIFACQDFEGNINSKIRKAGYEVKILKSNSFDELDILLKSLEIDLLIIDHYKIDYDFEKQLKIQNSKLKILSFDDTYEKHYCDILLNHNIYANEKNYEGKNLKGTKLLCGSKHTLLRNEFTKKDHFKKPLKYAVMVCLGGTDFDNITLEIAKVLIKFGINIKLITSSSNINIKSLERFTFLNKNCKLIINSNKIAYEMARSNLAVVSGSSIVHEVVAMGVPFITIITQTNQEKMLEYMKKNKLPVLKKFEKNRFRQILKKVIS